MKLARVVKASRILKRKLVDTLMGRLELTYAVLKMAQLLMALLLWSHWQACLWGLGAVFMDERTWITRFQENAGYVVEAWEVYVVRVVHSA